jgi:hypothetical protein
MGKLSFRRSPQILSNVSGRAKNISKLGEMCTSDPCKIHGRQNVQKKQFRRKEEKWYRKVSSD